MRSLLVLLWQCACGRSEDVNILYLQIISICIHYRAKHEHLDWMFCFLSMVWAYGTKPAMSTNRRFSILLEPLMVAGGGKGHSTCKCTEAQWEHYRRRRTLFKNNHHLCLQEKGDIHSDVKNNRCRIGDSLILAFTRDDPTLTLPLEFFFSIESPCLCPHGGLD